MIKIIQISCVVDNKTECGYITIGLSDEGKLYYWGRKDVKGYWRTGWVEKKDEINLK